MVLSASFSKIICIQDSSCILWARSKSLQVSNKILCGFYVSDRNLKRESPAIRPVLQHWTELGRGSYRNCLLQMGASYRRNWQDWIDAGKQSQQRSWTDNKGNKLIKNLDVWTDAIRRISLSRHWEGECILLHAVINLNFPNVWSSVWNCLLEQISHKYTYNWLLSKSLFRTTHKMATTKLLFMQFSFVLKIISL